jgi:hypothetical protein
MSTCGGRKTASVCQSHSPEMAHRPRPMVAAAARESLLAQRPGRGRALNGYPSAPTPRLLLPLVFLPFGLLSCFLPSTAAFPSFAAPVRPPPPPQLTPTNQPAVNDVEEVDLYGTPPLRKRIACD